MQHVLAFLTLSLLAVPNAQSTSSDARIAQVPEGITLVADKNADIPGNGPTQAATVHVNMLLMLTESNGYWVVMAEIVDDASKPIMQAGGMVVSKRR